MRKSSFLIAGKHAVMEALKNPKRKVLRVFLNEASKKNINRENQNYNLFKGIKIFEFASPKVRKTKDVIRDHILISPPFING